LPSSGVIAAVTSNSTIGFTAIGIVQTLLIIELLLLNLTVPFAWTNSRVFWALTW